MYSITKLNDAIVSQAVQATYYVNESGLVNSSNSTDCHEGHSSAPVGDVEKAKGAIVSESVPVSQYVDESELDGLADSDDVNALLDGDSSKPNWHRVAPLWQWQQMMQLFAVRE